MVKIFHVIIGGFFMKKMTRFLTLALVISAFGARPVQAMRVEQNEAMFLAGITGLVAGGVTYWVMDESENKKESSSGYKFMKFLAPVTAGGLSAWGMYKVLQGFSFESWKNYTAQKVKREDGTLKVLGLVDEKGNVVPVDAIDAGKVAVVLKKRRAGNPHALPLGSRDLDKTKQDLGELQSKWSGLMRPSDSQDVLDAHSAMNGFLADRIDRVADAQVALGDRPDFQAQSAAYEKHKQAERLLIQQARQHADTMAVEREKVRAAQERAAAAQRRAGTDEYRAFNGR
jgi:hypothetical protein